MPAISFASRALTLQFTLGNKQSFDNSGNNVLTIAGLQVVASFQNALVPSLPSCVMRIYGMTLDQMNRLTVAGLYIYQKNVPTANTVSIAAGIVNGSMSTIFSGGIVEAYPDGNQPDMSFFVRAYYSGAIAVSKITPTTFNGSVPASTVMQSICTKAGIGFENNNVSAVLSSPYFAGSARDQLSATAAAAGAYMCFDPVSNRAAAWPKLGGSRPDSSVVVSPATGMIGYPQFQSGLIKVKTIYDPALHFRPGVPFKVQSQFAAASGTWIPADINIDLSSQLPKGPWEISVTAYPKDFPPA